MTDYLLLGAGWLLLPLPMAVLIGKCIAVGQAGETARHAADAVLRDAAAATTASVASPPSHRTAPDVPAQRRPDVHAEARS